MQVNVCGTTSRATLPLVTLGMLRLAAFTLDRGDRCMATKHYATLDFFRRMPNPLLARYFHGKQLLEHIDFDTLHETKPEALNAAWLDLDDEVRQPLETDFRDIFYLGSEKGWHALRDEAEYHLCEKDLAAFIESQSLLDNHLVRAMIAFLDFPAIWRGAQLFFHADSLSYWRKRKHMGHNPAAVDEGSQKLLEKRIGDHFHFTEGRGRNCRVDCLRRGDLNYFFAYPEDFSQHAVEWVEGSFKRRPHNPAFEVIFVYSEKEGSLDMNFRGVKKAMVPLQAIFAEIVLGLDELPADPADESVYDLTPLLRRDFEFVIPPGSSIESALVKRLRLSHKNNGSPRIILEINPNDGPGAIYDLLDKVGESVPLQHYDITQVEITTLLRIDAGKRAKRVPITITRPNSCSLKYEERDLILRSMLDASNIEPK